MNILFDTLTPFVYFFSMNQYIENLRKRAKGLKRETYALCLAYHDPRVPWYAKAIGELLNILPDTKDIRLLYDPEKSGVFVRRLREAARERNVELTARAIRHPADVPLILSELKGGTGVFWMLPDTTVIAPETREALFLFSLETKTPVLAFADQHLELGATLSIGIDPYDIGCQAGELAQQILSGQRVENGHMEARKAVVVINEKAVLQLGITFDQKILKNNRGGH